MNGNITLRRALAAAGIRVSVKAEEVEDGPPILIDGFTLRLHRAGGDALDYVDRVQIDFALHASHGTTTSGRRAVLVWDWDEAQAEAEKYDGVALFGEYLFEAWRWSMSAASYYPDLAPGGPYESYGAYRHKMEMEKGCHAALRIMGFLGPDTYESLERAARADAMEQLGSFGEIAFERRADDIYAMVVRDPVYLVDDAAFAAKDIVPAVLRQHEADGERLGCPYCRRMFGRSELAIVPFREEDGRRWGVSWGCSDCTGNWSYAITLDRMLDVESAMRWTVHMFQKPYMLHPIAVAGWIASLQGVFGEKLSLWREAAL